MSWCEDSKKLVEEARQAGVELERRRTQGMPSLNSKAFQAAVGSRTTTSRHPHPWHPFEMSKRHCFSSKGGASRSHVCMLEAYYVMQSRMPFAIGLNTLVLKSTSPPKRIQCISKAPYVRSIRPLRSLTKALESRTENRAQDRYGHRVSLVTIDDLVPVWTMRYWLRQRGPMDEWLYTLGVAGSDSNVRM